METNILDGAKKAIDKFTASETIDSDDNYLEGVTHLLNGRSLGLFVDFKKVSTLLDGLDAEEFAKLEEQLPKLKTIFKAFISMAGSGAKRSDGVKIDFWANTDPAKMTALGLKTDAAFALWQDIIISSTGNSSFSSSNIYLHTYLDMLETKYAETVEDWETDFEGQIERTKNYRTDFEDVPDEIWYSDEVKEIQVRGVAKGDGIHYRPADQITRAEFLTMALRTAYEYETPQKSIGFISGLNPATRAKITQYQAQKFQKAATREIAEVNRSELPEEFEDIEPLD